MSDAGDNGIRVSSRERETETTYPERQKETQVNGCHSPWLIPVHPMARVKPWGWELGSIHVPKSPRGKKT
jgi:hypothetical protein